MIEHELKFQGRGLSEAFEAFAQGHEIQCNFFDTDYFDCNHILQDAGFSFRARKGNVELKQTHGVRRVELRHDTDDLREGFTAVAKHELAPRAIKRLSFDDLTQTMTITAARQSALRTIHIPYEIAEVEAALDHVEYYNADMQQIGEDEEYELEIIKMTNIDGSLHVITDEDLEHLQKWAMYGQDIRPQPLSKPERGHLYNEIVTRVF